MSTYLYLRCDAHDPPLRSGQEVGQHLYDLPLIRECIGKRQSAWLEGYEPPEDYFEASAWRFLREHPHCPISIHDEYGREHPVNEETYYD